MSLMTYKDARPWARAIREAVVQRKMPPWHADPKAGEFLNDPRLSDADVAAIDARNTLITAGSDCHPDQRWYMYFGN